MASYKGLDDLALRILANLNEAGEEHVSSLFNTVLHSIGSDSDREKYVNVLRRLFDRGFIEFAEERSATTMEWIVLPKDESSRKLDLLESQLSWDGESGYWTWIGDQPRLEVLATDAGLELSNDILERFGWQMTEPI